MHRKRIITFSIVALLCNLSPACTVLNDDSDADGPSDSDSASSVDTDTADPGDTATDTASDTGTQDTDSDTLPLDYCEAYGCAAIAPTGQTACFDDWGAIDCRPWPCVPSDEVDHCGQDNQYQTESRLFEVFFSGNNRLVLDRLLGLTWQGCPAGLEGKSCTEEAIAPHAWSEAIAYCDDLLLGGHDDWRLPDYHELAGIVDYGRSYPAIDPVAFPKTPAYYFWTSSLSAGATGFPWDVNFSDGHVVAMSDPSAPWYVRCVRGASPQPPAENRFHVEGPSGEEFVRDEFSGLEWQQQEESGLTWGEALLYCEQLQLGGEDDWRLPNINELRSLVDWTLVQPASTFPNMPGDITAWFWSSTTVHGEPYAAFYIRFAVGNVVGFPDEFFDYKLSGWYKVRCVRGISR